MPGSPPAWAIFENSILYKRVANHRGSVLASHPSALGSNLNAQLFVSWSQSQLEQNPDPWGIYPSGNQFERIETSNNLGKEDPQLLTGEATVARVGLLASWRSTYFLFISISSLFHLRKSEKKNFWWAAAEVEFSQFKFFLSEFRIFLSDCQKS